MKEEYRGYRPGDRVQMVECNDPYAPILPGEKGTIAHIDDAGTLHMKWDNGRTLGVCLGEDTIRKISLEQEMELLNAESLMQCDESRWDVHCEQSVAFTGAMQNFAEEQGCDWVVKHSFIDEAHPSRQPRYQHIESAALDDLIEGCDLKNGTDVGFMSKRPTKQQSAAIVVYGQTYIAPSGRGIVTELLECRLVSPAASRDFRERIDAGWNPDGKAAMQLFNSPGDHQPLVPLIRKCQELARTYRGRDRRQER